MKMTDLLTNVKAAKDLTASVEDPVIRTFLEICEWQVLYQFIRHDGLTDEEYEQRLPTAPFDILFYIQRVKRIFEQKEKVQMLLNGDLRAFDTFPEPTDKA